jgi:TetR/AcrR family transcriptional regulator, cholesterol catabolism regulator
MMEIVAKTTPPRRSRPVSARGRLREQQIVDAAAHIFSRQGYAATTIQEVADEVGILKGSLYHYMETKEDLLYRIITEIHENALRNVTETGERSGPAVERLRHFLEAHIASFDANRDKISVFYSEYRHLEGERRTETFAKRAVYEDFVRGMVRDGQAEGSFCPDVDPGFAVRAMLTMANSVHMWFRPDGPSTITAVARDITDYALHGLRCDPATHTPGHRASWGREPETAG